MQWQERACAEEGCRRACWYRRTATTVSHHYPPGDKWRVRPWQQRRISIVTVAGTPLSFPAWAAGLTKRADEWHHCMCDGWQRTARHLRRGGRGDGPKKQSPSPPRRQPPPSPSLVRNIVRPRRNTAAVADAADLDAQLAAVVPDYTCVACGM